MRSTASPSGAASSATSTWAPAPRSSLRYSPGERPSAKAKVRDMSMAMTSGWRSSITVLQHLPLLGAPQLGLRASTAARVHLRAARAAPGNTPPCVPPPSASRSTPCSGPAVEEDVDGAPARGEGRGRHERREHRVLVVLAHRHHPHVDAVLAHQRRTAPCPCARAASPAAARPARAACRRDARARPPVHGRPETWWHRRT